MSETLRFENRREMLSLVPPGGRIAEIGVFAGDFAQQLLDECRPRELVLFDLWPDGMICSGDVDGNDMAHHLGPELEAKVRKRFADTPEVTIVKGCSSQIRNWPADTFDALYIDGDHSYRGVWRDLVNGWRVVKDGGWLMGHDFDVNPDKARTVHQFGVKDAVMHFCQDYGETIHALGMDGYVSFAIRVHKGGILRRAKVATRVGTRSAKSLAKRLVRAGTRRLWSR